MESSSGWELHKENIQPLSAGRNISLLKHSLDTSRSMADHDADVEQHVSELENNIQEYVGEDPIEPYLALVRFLEQQCLQTITWKKSLATARIQCYKTFYDNPKYENDKRYVDAIIKCLNDTLPEPGRRLNSLLQCLNKKGIGRTVGQMYMIIADLQESIGKANEARQTLKLGIENNAQPIEKLQDTLSELEFRIAGDLAKMMNVGQPAAATADSRNFGSSVPVFGEKNDAPVFRNDLNPAAPVMDRQLSGTKLQRMTSASQIPLFCNENENDPVSSSSSGSGISRNNVGFTVVENALEPKSDKENKLNPSKWNKPEVVVEPEPRPYEAPPREKITIFTDEITEVRSNLRRPAVQEGVLKERRPEPDTEVETGLSSTDPVRSRSPPDSAPNPITVDNNQQPPANRTSSGTDVSSSVVDNAPMIIPNARLMCFRSFLPNGNPASFEHRQRMAWRKKNQDKELIAQLQKDKADLQAKVLNIERELEQVREVEQSLRDNFETELKHKTIKEGQWEQQRHSYKDTISQLTAAYSEVKEYVKQLRVEHRESIENLEDMKRLHEEELADIKSTHAAKVEELLSQIQRLEQERAQQQQQQISVDSTNSNTGSLPPTSSSNENECTFFMKAERQEGHRNTTNKMSQSNHSLAITTDKLFNGTGMGSFMGSFMAPPSRVAEISGTGEISINPEPSSFNASVKMSGATTVYGWRGDDIDNKTRFGFNASDICGGDSPFARPDRVVTRDTTGNDTAPSAADINIGIAPVMLPPPPSVSKKFVLYESMADSHSTTRGGFRKPADLERPQGVDFRTLSENVAPESGTTSHPPVQPVARLSSNVLNPTSTRKTSVSARIAEIEAMSNSGMEPDDENRVRSSRETTTTASENYPGTVGQTFTRPAPVTGARRQSILPKKNQNYKMDNGNDDDEPPFEPFVPSPLPPQRRCDPYQPPELPFDISNLTSALQFDPPPLLNSTPTRSTFSGIRRVQSSDMYAGNCVHTQRIPRMSELLREIEGPMSPRHEERDNMDWMQDRAQRIAEFHRHEPPHDESMQLNLSPIQETSKENRSSCTTGSSSSGNMTSTTRGGGTMSGVSMFHSNSRSVSGGGPRSVSSISRSIRYNSHNQ